ncbi:pentapeptide repeat-containing protein [Nonomuraea sp. NPDC005983]|uniref:pentapeptide repeat-containing protein n=1 Tax=Nonomuraea sp. NPDC005983 TaxID=3155595 RepID=UPI0033BA0348
MRSAQIRRESRRLEDADLRGAYLAEADLHRAVLDGARLEGANFVSYPTGWPAAVPKRLTVEQLAKAVIDDATQLPGRFRQALQDTAHLRPRADADPAGRLSPSADPLEATDVNAGVRDVTSSSDVLPRGAATGTGSEEGDEPSEEAN